MEKEYREHILSHYENFNRGDNKSKPSSLFGQKHYPWLILKDANLLQRMVSTVKKSQTYFLVEAPNTPNFESP